MSVVGWIYRHTPIGAGITAAKDLAHGQVGQAAYDASQGTPATAVVGAGVKGTINAGKAVVGAIKSATAPASTDQIQDDRQRAIDFYNQLNGDRAGAATNVSTVQGQTVAAPQIDTANADATRAAQMEYINALHAQATGAAPSPADAMLAQAQQQTAAQQQGIAGQAHGSAGVAARRAAIMGIGAGDQNAAAQIASQRAQEQQAALGQEGNALAGVQAADSNLAIERARQGLAASTSTAQLQQGADLANQGAGLQGQQITDSYRLGLGNTGLGALGNAGTSSANILAADAAAKNRQLQLLGYAAGGVTTAGQGLIASDERVKTDVRREDDASVDRALRTIDMYSYRYRDPAADGPGQRHGPMAQDLERDPILRSTVAIGPDGVKRVDTGALSLVMAGLTARKLQRVERR